MKLTPELVARMEGRDITFARVVSSRRGRITVDLAGIALGFSERSGLPLEQRGRGYRLLVTLPRPGHEWGTAALQRETAHLRRRRARRPRPAAPVEQHPLAQGELDVDSSARSAA